MEFQMYVRDGTNRTRSRGEVGGMRGGPQEDLANESQRWILPTADGDPWPVCVQSQSQLGP